MGTDTEWEQGRGGTYRVRTGSELIGVVSEQVLTYLTFNFPHQNIVVASKLPLPVCLPSLLTFLLVCMQYRLIVAELFSPLGHIFAVLTQLVGLPDSQCLPQRRP